MQFNVLALALAAMATVASAQTVTVTEYSCAATTAPVPAYTPSPTATGVASTGGAIYPTSSPIAPFEGSASIKGVSALGLFVAGGVALFL